LTSMHLITFVIFVLGVVGLLWRKREAENDKS